MTAPSKTAKPKKPQDRKPKASPEGVRDVTVDGLKLRIVTSDLDDFELVDDLARLEDGEHMRAPSALRRILGTEQYRIVLDHLRDPDTQRVTNEAASTFVGELFEVLNPNS